jgi:hypothetical protein
MDTLQEIKQLFAIADQVDAGFSALAIEGVEQRLQVQLPSFFKTYYLQVGKDQKLNQSHNSLVSPDKLWMKDDFLCFYEENQGVVTWAMHRNDLEAPVTPVYYSYDQVTWEKDSPRIEDFFLSMAYWQGALGGLAYWAMSEDLDQETFAAIQAQYKEITRISYWNNRHFSNYPTHIIEVTVDGENKPNGIFIGANNKSDFDEIVSLVGEEFLDIEEPDEGEE